jgi:preprotein translocase subunit SecE
MAKALEGAGESPRKLSSNIVARKFQAMGQFYRDVRLEMKRVTWPTREEVYQTTVVTVIVVLFFGYFLSGTNQLLAYLVKSLMDFLSN